MIFKISLNIDFFRRFPCYYDGMKAFHIYLTNSTIRLNEGKLWFFLDFHTLLTLRLWGDISALMPN
jgi:hypothetical protein